MPESTLAQITFLQEQCQKRLDVQLDAVDSLDTKLTAFLSMGVGLVVAVAAVMAIDTGRLTWWIALPLLVMIASFLVMLGCGVVAIGAHAWQVGAELDAVEIAVQQEGEEMTRRRLTRSILASIAENGPAYRRKVVLIRPVFVALVVEAVATLVALGSLVH